jgi:opacity protein-like surface antigen
MTLKASAFLIASVTALSFAVSAAAQESGGATSGGATSTAPAPEQQQPPPPPPPPPPPYTPPPPPPELGGWYLGAAGGWDSQNSFRLADSFGDLGTFNTDDSGLLIGAIGYKFFGSPIRVEVEGGYTWHGINSFELNGTGLSAGGHMNLGHFLVNGLYDFPLSDQWTISLGGGIGAGFESFHTIIPALATTGKFSQTGFMWQAIGEISYKLAPNVDLFADYRYRDAVISNTQPFIPPPGTVTVYGPSENAILAGVRWYLWSPGY